ncbi:mannose-6-phosphate isomerase [Arthrobacter sp. UYP6]|uniref:class I mannose-6-phosphate isomerase n=1 Tax=Arthrobacter sp. UYP6 TaxID=1756378 RepID=UPI003395E276
MTAPIFISSNQPADRFYRGGEKIRAFRGTGAAGERVPEDWVGSTTTLFGESALGLSELGPGRLLRDEISTDPGSWLGPEHLARYGADTMLLVKLLDAGQRLPVHLHPEQAFAAEHLDRRHGKAEAWYILEGGSVHLGFTRDISAEELRSWVDGQDVEAMLAAMHRVDVNPGDSVYVPPGCPHAIGSGIFLVEVQEPEDLSILLEWKDFAIEGTIQGHLGLGFDTALQATDTGAVSAADLDALVMRGGTGEGTLADAARSYFRAERTDVAGSAVLEPGFSVLVVLDGSGTLTTADGTWPLAAGNTVLLPFSAGELQIDGALSLMRCRPPKP